MQDLDRDLRVRDCQHVLEIVAWQCPPHGKYLPLSFTAEHLNTNPIA